MAPENAEQKDKMAGAAPDTNTAPAEPVAASATPGATVATPEVNAPATTQEAAVVPEVAPAVAPTAAPAKPAGEKVNFLQTILQTFTKPMTILREDLPKYGSWKNAGILAGIVLVASVLLSIIATFFKVVFSYYCSGYGKSATCEAKFDFGMLEYWKFGTFLLETIASTVVVMLVLAGVFFGIAKLFKAQKANFCRCLTVVSLAMLPMIAASFVAGFTGSFVSTSSYAEVAFPVFMAVLTSMISMMGMIFAAVIFYEGVTREAELEGDKKVHYTLLSAVATLVVLGILVWLIGDKIGLDSFLPILSF